MDSGLSRNDGYLPDPLSAGAALARPTFHHLRYVAEPPVATLTLDCPATANCLHQPLAAELREACRLAAEDGRLRALVITGAGDAFSVGREAPPPELTAAPAEARLAWVTQRKVASAVAALPIPVVAALNGDTLDHGLELALAADLRVAAGQARLGIRDLALGRFPWDGGTQRLPRLVGPAWARDLLLTGRVVDAAQALEIGLVNRVVEPGQLAQEARRLAEAIAAGGPLATRYVREAVTQGLDLSLAQGLRLEADLNFLLHTTADRTEGLRAFRERRSPRFSGE
jgi:enoyl-CoA hydratase/carnithine racemase